MSLFDQIYSALSSFLCHKDIKLVCIRQAYTHKTVEETLQYTIYTVLELLNKDFMYDEIRCYREDSCRVRSSHTGEAVRLS